MHAERLAGKLTARQAALQLARRPGLAWLDGDGASDEGRFAYLACDPVEIVRDTDAMRFDDDAYGPRYIGYVGYDAAWRGATKGEVPRAKAPRVSIHEREDEATWFGRYDAVLRIDVRSGEALALGDDERATGALIAKLESAPRAPSARARSTTSTPRARHLHAIELALEHIGRGDIYQVNLARHWDAELEGDPLALYLAMRAASPVPLGAYLDCGDAQVLCCSMERFLDVRDGRLVSRPIKGTIARSAGYAQKLLADPKEHAEHSMIVDLVRNDLSRVAKTGSVRVDRALEVEPYAKLAHLVSTVSCEANGGLREILEATFPPGSVTGTPKLRAIEIIDALEPAPRDVYTGAIGFVDARGAPSLNVAIRTAVVRAGRVRYFAGGGIVEASDPEREVEETELKARVFLDAIETLRDGALAHAE